ncbi:MAG TPA: hypothetical protein VK776_01115 [Bryobacteraceae bacterium]|nr:hypothetical protein [Bryobacteraceae bacterium]
MRKIKEVLRLKFDVGLGLRQIARSCSIGLGTAHEYLHRAEAAKIAWPLGPEWDDDRLEAALFGGPPRSRPTVLAMPESTSTITSRSTRTATACLTTSFKNWWRSARRRRSLRSFTRASVWRHTCVHTVMVTPSRLPSTVRVPTKRILNGHRRRMVHWAQTIGPNTGRLFERILADKPHPEMGYRSCLGIIRLADQYSPARVEAAAERALRTGACRYQSVKSILKNSLDAIPTAAPPPSSPPPLHDNIRGAEYFE